MLVFLERNLEMIRKLASFALLAAVAGMFVGTSDAEAGHRNGRRNRCCQTSNFGHGNYGQGSFNNNCCSNNGWGNNGWGNNGWGNNGWGNNGYSNVSFNNVGFDNSGYQQVASCDCR